MLDRSTEPLIIRSVYGLKLFFSWSLQMADKLVFVVTCADEKPDKATIPFAVAIY